MDDTTFTGCTPCVSLLLLVYMEEGSNAKEHTFVAKYD